MAAAIPVALLVLGLLAASALLANRLGTAPPVVQTVIGILLGFIPAFPRIDLEPRFVMLGVLPPLVYAAAVELPWDDFRDNLRPISALAFGLVAVTTAVVAAAAQFLIPGMTWPAAVVLGAIVSPTDPVATSAVAAHLGVPRRLTAIIEGEGLVNDAVSLTIYRLALAAVLAGTFTLAPGVLRFVLIVGGEIAYGSVVGWLAARVRALITDPRAEITVSLLTPFAAYLIPEMLGGSGVLATVAAGMYIGEQTPELVPSGTRLHLTGVWDMITYVLNGGLFLLTGLQLRQVWTGASGFSPVSLVTCGVAVSLVVIVTRFAWTWPAAWISRAFLSGTRRNDPMPSNSHLAFVSWSGMRGGISLAAALAIPLAVQGRTLIVFLTACVIASTLLLQGATLPYVIRFLRLDRQARREREETQRAELQARLECIRAALRVINLSSDGNGAKLLREDYEYRANRLGEVTADRDVERHRADFVHETNLERAAIEAERRCVIDLHRQGRITEDVLRRLERELDLRDSLLSDRLRP